MEILSAKQTYKTKVESKLAERKLASAWSAMKIIAGIQQSKNRTNISMDGFRSDGKYILISFFDF